MCVSKLEELPDEILLQICIFLNTYDTLNAFGYLNNRFQQTINEFLREMNLQNVTLEQYNHWYLNFLPITTNYLVKLILSNAYTPGQIYLFNKSIKIYRNLNELFPYLKELYLINFNNTDVDILSKVLTLDKIMIDIDSYFPLLCSTEDLFDYYLFCSVNQFKEIRLYGMDGGIHLQHNRHRQINSSLECLTISVQSIDDMILLFQCAPNLLKLYIVVNENSNELTHQFDPPKYLTDFHFESWNKYVLNFDRFNQIISSISTLKLLSLQIETDDLNYANGYLWNNILSHLNYFEHLNLGIKIWFDSNKELININSLTELRFPICWYNDNQIFYIDTIPYNFRRIHFRTTVLTSPCANQVQTNKNLILHKPARHVHQLTITGWHEITLANHWLSVINRFPNIKILELNSINIHDSDDNPLMKEIRLPYLHTLFYLRSTKCQMNISFFLFLSQTKIVTPHLRYLVLMYGDMIYFCKRLPDIRFERIEGLWLGVIGSDGHVNLKDIDVLTNAFPNLHHFSIYLHSSKFLDRNIQEILEKLLYSLRKFSSFRIACKKGSLKLSTFINDTVCEIWIKRICHLNNDHRIQLIRNRKEFSIWK